MREIQLTMGKVALVDDADFDFLNQWKWYARKNTHTFYAERNDVNEIGKRIQIQMHRVILGLTDPKLKGDHRDHNGLNNQRYNLRVATYLQNAANTKSRKNSTSKYLGVCFKTSQSKWCAQIQFNSTKKHLGLFETEEEAARTYDNAARKHFGEFANLNFPQL